MEGNLSLIEKSEIVSMAPLDAGIMQVLVCPYVDDAEAARDIGLNLIPVSWSGDYRLVDWTPLKGRKVIVWENNDVDGAVRMSEIAGRVRQAGAKYVKIVRRPEAEKPWEWSIKDAVYSDQWEAADLINYAKANAVDWTVAYHADRVAEQAKTALKPVEIEDL
jgi:hypothetical protein